MRDLMVRNMLSASVIDTLLITLYSKVGEKRKLGALIQNGKKAEVTQHESSTNPG